jgi:hypothetical protein
MLKAKRTAGLSFIISGLYPGIVVSVLEYPPFPHLNLFTAIFAWGAQAALRPGQCRVGSGATPGR